MRTPVLERFMDKVAFEPMSGCWLWSAGAHRSGYGAFGMGGAGNTEYAHRASYRLLVGAIPSGASVLHKCDNPACVNPEHLFLGSQSDNMWDCAFKGRNKNQKRTHCSNGHEFTAENTYTRDGNPPWRRCKTCVAVRAKTRTQRSN